MRYAHGIIIGALLPGIIFMGSIYPKILSYGVTDPTALGSIWSLYVLWFFISLAIALIPLMVAYGKWRESFREFLIFEAGGFAFFSPLWLLLATDLSGDSWTDIIFNGIEQGLLAPGPGGQLIGIDIGPVFLVPMLVAMLIIGIVMLRPSFVKEHGRRVAKPSKPEPEKPVSPPTTDPLEDELPGVKPPVSDEMSKSELRVVLTELGIPDQTINAIFNAGYESITDIVATSAEQLAISTGLDKTTAENLHMAVQKRVWFGGI